MKPVVERAAAGDPDALGELWRGHQHLVLRYFRGRGMAEPEDLASTVWLEVARSLHTFTGGPSDFRRWLFTIAARRRVDEIRRSKRVAKVDPVTDRLSATSMTEEGYERAASLERALARVRTLPDDQAEAVLLRILADLDVADVARIMGRSQGNVRVLVHRGLKRLADDARTAGHDRGDRVQIPSTPPRARSARAVTAGAARSIYAV